MSASGADDYGAVCHEFFNAAKAERKMLSKREWSNSGAATKCWHRHEIGPWCRNSLTHLQGPQSIAKYGVSDLGDGAVKISTLGQFRVSANTRGIIDRLSDHVEPPHHRVILMLHVVAMKDKWSLVVAEHGEHLHLTVGA